MNSGTLTRVEALDAAQQGALRELRLWHWLQGVQNRELARRVASGALALAYNDTANRHLGYVVTLNAFFDKGDTAEQDESKARADRR